MKREGVCVCVCGCVEERKRLSVFNEHALSCM